MQTYTRSHMPGHRQTIEPTPRHAPKPITEGDRFTLTPSAFAYLAQMATTGRAAK